MKFIVIGKRVMPLFVSLSIAAFFTGCALRPTIIPTSEYDTPEKAYQEGMRLLDEGKFFDAAKKFERALGLDPKYQPAYIGLADVFTEWGIFDKAEKNLKKAKKLNKKNPAVYVAWGRFYAAQWKNEKAEEQFALALEYNSKWAPAYYYRGQMYEKYRNTDAAQKEYKQALNVNPDYYKASEAWNRLQKIDRAAEGMPNYYKKIAEADSLTRADIAFLMIVELNVETFIKQTEEEVKVNIHEPYDIANHRMKDYIRRVLEIGVMEAFPDKLFNPNSNVNRTEFAMLMEKIIVRVTGDESVQTKFIGSESPFPDVENSHYAFNAIMTTTTRGILSAGTDGKFGPMEPVKGADALLAVKKLKAELEKK